MNAAPTEQIHDHTYADWSQCKHCGGTIWAQKDNPEEFWTHIVGGEVECP